MKGNRSQNPICLHAWTEMLRCGVPSGETTRPLMVVVAHPVATRRMKHAICLFIQLPREPRFSRRRAWAPNACSSLFDSFILFARQFPNSCYS